jgi:predicted DNA-binding WGR domain protein
MASCPRPLSSRTIRIWNRSGLPDSKLWLDGGRGNSHSCGRLHRHEGRTMDRSRDFEDNRAARPRPTCGPASCRESGIDGGPASAYHLTRVDPSRNMARWYAVSVEVTLFAQWACRRAYGRMGCKGIGSGMGKTRSRRSGGGGRIMLGLHATRQEAEAELSDLLRRKLARGYRPAADQPGLIGSGCSSPAEIPSGTPPSLRE